MGIKFAVSKVKEIMTEKPILISPDTTVFDAAQKMKKTTCGCLPIGDGEKFFGMITARDIVVNVIADDKNPKKALVKDFMREADLFCYEDDTIEQASEIMHLHRVGCLTVKNKENLVTGWLSFVTILSNDASPDDIAKVIKNSAGPVSC